MVSKAGQVTQTGRQHNYFINNKCLRCKKLTFNNSSFRSKVPAIHLVLSKFMLIKSLKQNL